MKKIVMLYSGDSNALNGAALYVKRIKKHSSYFNGYSIEICDDNSITNGEDNEDKIAKLEAEYADGDMYHKRKEIKNILTKSKLGNNIFLYMAWIRHAKRLVKKHNDIIKEADILLAHDIFSAYYGITKFPNKKLIFVMHNSGDVYAMLYSKLPHLKKSLSKKYLDKIKQTVYSKSNYITFVSKKARDLFKSQNLDFASKAVYVPEGLEDIETIVEHDFSSIKLISVGTLCERKNQLAIIKAIEKLSNPSISLVLVGGGSEAELYKRYCETNNVKNVEFTGPVNNSDVIHYLNKNNIFIMTSHDEGLPAVGIEAIRSGLPIIVTDVGGCAELVNENGIVINDDEAEVVYAIENISKKDAISLSEMSEKSRQLYEKNFSLQSMYEVYESLFDSLI